MVLKGFMLEVPGKGKIEVEFYLDFENLVATVKQIKIHSDFESPIPHKVQLKKDEGRWKLFVEHPVRMDGEIAVLPEFLNDDISLAIADRIVSFMENE